MKQIQWFPGHMNKTRRLIRENLPSVDVIIEILDARVPESSRNPMVKELIGDKPRLVVLNKTDLADPGVTKVWMKRYAQEPDVLPLALTSKDRNQIKKIIPSCRQLGKDRNTRKRRALRAMIIGIPNVGKSTVINALKGQKKAGVQNKPGHTRHLQRVALSPDFELVDTPGILWPKFEDKKVGYRLAMLGSIKDEILDLFDIAGKALLYLRLNYPEALKERYKLTDMPEDSMELLELIGRKRGMLQKGGIVDMERICNVFLSELREGKIGRISLEKPLEDTSWLES